MSDVLANSKTLRAALVLLALSVTALAAYLHSGGLHDVIAWDEANYTFAAKEGIIANALELGELSKLRHRHAPLMCYTITLSTAIFGNDEWAIRLPAVLACAVSCGLLVLIAFDLARGQSYLTRLMCGVIAGLVLATSPASIELAGVIQPHSFVILFLLLNLWTLGRYLRDLKRSDALLFGLSLAGQFVTMEYGPVILCLALLSVALAQPALLFDGNATMPGSVRDALKMLVQLPRQMHRDIKHAAVICLIATAILWPAGVFLLGIPFNFVFFLLYAANGHPVLFRGEMHLHVPKYAYAYWYALDYPLLLAGMIIAIVLIGYWAMKQRSAVAVMLMVFTFGLTASVHGAHIMQLCKSIFLVPPIALGGPIAFAAIASRLSAPRRLWFAAVAMSVAVMSIIGAQTMPMSRADDPNLKLVKMTKLIAEQASPDDHVLAQGWPMVRYLLHLKMNRPDIQVAPYDPRNYESDRLGERLESHEFNWAITIGPTTTANRNCKALAALRHAWPIVSDLSLEDREYRVYRAPQSIHTQKHEKPSMFTAAKNDTTLKEHQR